MGLARSGLIPFAEPLWPPAVIAAGRCLNRLVRCPCAGVESQGIFILVVICGNKLRIAGTRLGGPLWFLGCQNAGQAEKYDPGRERNSLDQQSLWPRQPFCQRHESCPPAILWP